MKCTDVGTIPAEMNANQIIIWGRGGDGVILIANERHLGLCMADDNIYFRVFPLRVEVSLNTDHCTVCTTHVARVGTVFQTDRTPPPRFFFLKKNLLF